MSTSNMRMLGLLGVMGAIAACTTMGTGVGNARNGDIQADFAWKSTDDRTGTLTANLSNGDTFSGPFFQVTRDTRVETLDPLWYGWAGYVARMALLGPVSRYRVRHSLQRARRREPRGRRWRAHALPLHTHASAARDGGRR